MSAGPGPPLLRRSPIVDHLSFNNSLIQNGILSDTVQQREFSFLSSPARQFYRVHSGSSTRNGAVFRAAAAASVHRSRAFDPRWVPEASLHAVLIRRAAADGAKLPERWVEEHPDRSVARTIRRHGRCPLSMRMPAYFWIRQTRERPRRRGIGAGGATSHGTR